MTTTQSEITEERLLADLLDWLKKRSEPDAAGRRGPYVFDEPELQALAAALAKPGDQG